MIQLKLIAAACEDLGIGLNNNLPWRLKTEMAYFTRMTETTKNANKKNVVIMGRRTWDSIPPKFKPLSNRINFVLSRSPLAISEFKDSYSFLSLESAVDALKSSQFAGKFDSVWVIGGSQIYKLAMENKYFYRMYLTRIMKSFECDTFLPALPENLSEVQDPEVPVEVQSENGIEFVYKIYENPNSVAQV
ncbi:PREDICTED: dihydrofolate reductase [Nicrophorus vespilloides]|uniref:dihydrofolate reductase n=1 Tax=Nicrophorus vespilloides TaxID=110193 RepID=A0ABM1MD54_NICVS|nr:PREDICTED: dihydrofolate reductase [Nicrophorus vespilloides]